MITSEKRTIFQIEKIKKPISFYNKMNIQFKVLKRRKERVPWSQEVKINYKKYRKMKQLIY